MLPTFSHIPHKIIPPMSNTLNGPSWEWGANDAPHTVQKQNGMTFGHSGELEEDSEGILTKNNTQQERKRG